MSTNPETFTDGSEISWTREELQALVLQVGDFGSAANRLGKTRSEVNQAFRRLGVMTPAEYTRHLAKENVNDFRDLIIRHGSVADTATYLGVSVAHLRSVMDEVGIQWRHKKPETEVVQKALDRFGSAILAARLLDTTVTEIKRACPDWKERRDPLKTGRQAVATGRTGEILWAKIRGESTVDAQSLENHNHPGYDFQDREFGKVNVKTASPEKQKSKEIYTWTWEVDPNQDADVFPLVLLDRNYQAFAIILCNRDSERKMIFPEYCRVVTWANGKYGVSFKADSGEPNISGFFWRKPHGNQRD